MTGLVVVLGSVSAGDFFADFWRLGLTFGLTFGLLFFWYWMLSRLGTF